MCLGKKSDPHPPAPSPLHGRGGAKAGEILFVFDMEESLFEEAAYMVIVEGVIDMTAFFAKAHEIELAQVTELMRDGGLTHAERGFQDMDADFVVDEQRNQAQTIRIAEGFEDFCQSIGGWCSD